MKWKEIILPILIAIPACLALLVPGFYGASDDLHIAWLQQMDKTISSGQFPPRYVPDLSFGYGYPLFNFVFPLPFYVGEIFHKLGLSYVDSVKSVFALSFIASAIAMYGLSRKYTSIWVSLLAATIYIYTPYRSTDVYVRGAIGEAFAFIFLPIITLALSQPLTRKNISLGGLAISGLVLSHNIVAYMFLPLALVLGLLIHFKEKIKLFSVFLLGALASAYFWIPALIDSSLMKYDTVFNFVDHFPTLRQLITPFWGYGASVAGPYDGMSFFLGVSNIFGVIFLGYVCLKSRNKLAIWLLGCFLLCIFMMNFRSTFLWRSVPLLPYFQFPWRFLTITTFVSSLAVIFLPKIRILPILAIVAIIAFSYPIFRPHDFLGRNDAYYLNRYIPVPNPSVEYRELQEEYLRLPKATTKRPTDYIFQTPTFTTNLTSPQVLSFNKYFFPGWQGTIDGQKLQLSAGQPYGQIQFEVPAGEYQIKVFFAETPVKIFLDILSLVALIALCLSVLL